MYPRSSKVHEKNAQETFVSLDPRKHLYPFSVRYICIHISAVLTPTEFRFGGPIANILQITTGMLLYSCLLCVFLYRLSKLVGRFSHTLQPWVFEHVLIKKVSFRVWVRLNRQGFRVGWVRVRCRVRFRVGFSIKFRKRIKFMGRVKFRVRFRLGLG